MWFRQMIGENGLDVKVSVQRQTCRILKIVALLNQQIDHQLLDDKFSMCMMDNGWANIPVSHCISELTVR
jgi:hypothetical protein